MCLIEHRPSMPITPISDLVNKKPPLRNTSSTEHVYGMEL